MNVSAPAKRRDSLIYLLLILMAFALRLYQLDAQSFWYDEGVTATLAQRDLAALTAWTARDIQPPLYYYSIAGWGRMAGWSEWNLRFVSAWWGVLLVPLLAMVAHRLTHRRAVARLAALLCACHPLLLYYSQEARMYTMVVALGVLAGYLFLRLWREAKTPWRHWLVYTLVATAAVYTHYFAFFLLFAFGLTGLLTMARRQRARPQLIGAHLLVVLLFAAWLVPLFTQLATDRSYWQGNFKIDEAVQAIVLRFVVGETVLEQFAGNYLWLAGLITLLTLGTLLYTSWQQRSARAALLLSGSWLLLPTLCVIMLATIVPKFNVRYVMLALPGLILLWSWGAVALGDLMPTGGQRGGLFATLILLPLLLIFGIADRNWFTDHSFLKAQWREAAAYVRLHHEPGEAVVLVSGHTWPIWAYYAPDLPAIPLPDLQILDVDAVLDFTESGNALRHSLQGYHGAWLINWQEEVVDPTGVVPVQLAWTGSEKTFRSQFWEVGVRRFIDLEPSAIPTVPTFTERLDANFGNQLILVGYTSTKEDELLLFWQLAPNADIPQPDWQINLQSKTATGLPYYTPADRRPTDYHYPVARWQPGETVMALIPALDWAGPAAMPGHYQIQLRVYDPAADPAGLDRLNVQGQPLGKTVTLDLTLQEKTSDRTLPTPTAAVEISEGLQLAIEPAISSGEAGEAIATTLTWYPADDFTPVDLVVQWRRAADGTIAASTPLILPADLPMAQWPTRDWFRQVIALQLPVELAAGDYLLTVVAAHDVAEAEATIVQRPFTVRAINRSFTPPPLAVPLQVDLFATSAPEKPQLRLLGLRDKLPPTMETAMDTEATTVTLVWQAVAEQTTAAHAYAVTLQWLAADGLPVAQIDLPLAGERATWLPGEVISQTMTLVAPPPSEAKRLIVAIYDPGLPGNPRLVTAAGDDFIDLTRYP